MKVRIISTPITPYGSFGKGDVLTSDKYPETFLVHLVEAAGAAEYIEAKIVQPVTEVKIEVGGQLSESQIDQVLDAVSDRVDDTVIIKKAPTKKKRGRPKLS